MWLNDNNDNSLQLFNGASNTNRLQCVQTSCFLSGRRLLANHWLDSWESVNRLSVYILVKVHPGHAWSWTPCGHFGCHHLLWTNRSLMTIKQKGVSVNCLHFSLLLALRVEKQQLWTGSCSLSANYNLLLQDALNSWLVYRLLWRAHFVLKA